MGYDPASTLAGACLQDSVGQRGSLARRPGETGIEPSTARPWRHDRSRAGPCSEASSAGTGGRPQHRLQDPRPSLTRVSLDPGTLPRRFSFAAGSFSGCMATSHHTPSPPGLQRRSGNLLNRRHPIPPDPVPTPSVPGEVPRRDPATAGLHTGPSAGGGSRSFVPSSRRGEPAPSLCSEDPRVISRPRGASRNGPGGRTASPVPLLTGSSYRARRRARRYRHR